MSATYILRLKRILQIFEFDSLNLKRTNIFKSKYSLRSIYSNTLCQGKVIEVNSEGKDSNACCKEGKCLCGSLFEALFHVENNTVINITSSVPLHNSTHVERLENFTITGNNIIVE